MGLQFFQFSGSCFELTINGNQRMPRGRKRGPLPVPWSVDEANSKLDRRCFIVRG